MGVGADGAGGLRSIMPNPHLDTTVEPMRSSRRACDLHQARHENPETHMVIFRIVIAAFLLCSAGTAHPSANIAKYPAALRQTYFDGTSTELICKERKEPCVFVVRTNRKLKLTLEREYFGYSTSMAIMKYRYWPNSGHDLTISIDVDCKDEDFALAKDPEATCVLFLQRRDGALQARNLEILRSVGAPVYRNLQDSL